MAKTGTKNQRAYDLTQRPPRSCYVRLGGYVILPRLIDKARAALAGTLGDYYDGPDGMNGQFLRFVGLEHATLKRFIAKRGGDAEILKTRFRRTLGEAAQGRVEGAGGN